MSFEEIEPDIQDAVNKVSLVAAIVTFMTWSLIGFLRPGLINRVSLRFQIVIALVDALRHASNYTVRVPNGIWCAIVGVLSNFSDNLYVSLNTLLALNTYIIFISRKPKKTLYGFYSAVMSAYLAIVSICYYSKTFLSNLVNVLSTIANGAYGRSRHGNCNFKTRYDRIVSKFYMVILMEFPGVLYCAFVVFLVAFKFKERMSKLRIIRNDTYVRIEGEDSDPIKHVGALYWRISLYPISCVITMLPYLVAMILDDAEAGELSMWHSFLFRFCRRLTETTNFFFMLYDPNFRIALNEFIRYIKFKFNNVSRGDDSYELKEQRQAAGCRTGENWHDRIHNGGEWKIEFDDGHIVTLQDHVKCL